MAPPGALRAIALEVAGLIARNAPLSIRQAKRAIDGALHLGTEEALAFEDSRSGVQAATAAGVETVGMTTGLDAATLRGVGAAGTIADFTDPWLLGKLKREFERS